MKEGKPMTKVKDFFSRLLKHWQIMLPLLVILFMIAIAAKHVTRLPNDNQDDVAFEASGSINVDFNVFYIENESFPENPIPQGLNFLMSFTDFIEIESNFFARFSEEVEVDYTYTSAARLIVRHRGAASGELNPIIFEYIYPLSTANDQLVGRELRFPPSDEATDVEIYTIYPDQFLDIYLDFVAEYERINRTTGNQANFLVELQVEFIYDISIPDWSISETVVASYHIPLTEVYSFVPSEDDSTFTLSIDSPDSQEQATLPVIIVFVVIFSLSAFVLFKGIRNLQNDSDEFQQEIAEISKKYANEIIESSQSLLSVLLANQVVYTCVKVHKFESLLNLAINANEHIVSYHNDERAEFVVVKGNLVYYYEIDNSTAGLV